MSQNTNQEIEKRLFQIETEYKIFKKMLIAAVSFILICLAIFFNLTQKNVAKKIEDLIEKKMLTKLQQAVDDEINKIKKLATDAENKLKDIKSAHNQITDLITILEKNKSKFKRDLIIDTDSLIKPTKIIDTESNIQEHHIDKMIKIDTNAVLIATTYAGGKLLASSDANKYGTVIAKIWINEDECSKDNSGTRVKKTYASLVSSTMCIQNLKPGIYKLSGHGVFFGNIENKQMKLQYILIKALDGQIVKE